MILLGDRNKNKPSILVFWSCYLCLILTDYLYLFQQLGLVIFSCLILLLRFLGTFSNLAVCPYGEVGLVNFLFCLINIFIAYLLTYAIHLV